MDQQWAKALVKDKMAEYLQEKGINIRKPFRCLNPDHIDNHPSMSFDRKRNKVHCFSCGKDYDIFDVIGIEYGLKNKKEIFKKTYQVFGLTERTTGIKGKVGDSGASIEPQMSAMVGEGEKSRTISPPPPVDHTPYMKACHARINQTDYPQKRGLSPEVVERFGLGYDPAYRTGGKTWRALIIPTGKENFVARNTDESVDKSDRYRKTGPSRIYNAEALWRYGNEGKDAASPTIVVEGEIDALAVMSAGGEAVALGSISNSRNFLKLLETKKPVNSLILALDNDVEGQKASDALMEELENRGFSPNRMNLYGEAKDAGEAIIRDRDAFINAVKSVESMETQARLEEKEVYLRTNAAGRLQSFIDGIADSVNTPYIATGFERLDRVLDGGMYEGLYIVGAITSLGKTSLILQIADQIAQQGQDVLIFSLEMARNELISKSISRHTLMSVLQTGGNVRDAKTARGITTGKRYAAYSPVELRLIREAVEAYAEYAGHLYISEGIGDIGVAQVRDTVRKHLSITGNRPVVIVDYLQILAPYSDRATDKQNTDKAVLELKRVSRDFKVPVIGVSSFNRDNYKNAVTMEAFKESGAVEYSSDILIGLQLKGVGTSNFDAALEKKKNPREIELVVLKNRNGAAGEKIGFDYYPMFNYFQEQKG